MLKIITIFIFYVFLISLLYLVILELSKTQLFEIKEINECCRRCNKKCNMGCGILECRNSFLSNIQSNYLNVKSVSSFKIDDKYYVILNKNDSTVNEIENNNSVSLLIVDNSVESLNETLLYGELEIKKQGENLILYVLKINKRRISITTESNNSKTTYTSVDGSSPTNIKINTDEIFNFLSDM